jgi:four helix bundle protein
MIEGSDTEVPPAFVNRPSSNECDADVLKRRTKAFALDVLSLFRTLPKTTEARVLGTQLLRSSTSVAANYRAACRARSRSEFTAKMGLVVEESDEALFWLELLSDGGVVSRERTRSLLEEAHQLVAIFVASRRTASSRVPAV